MRRFWEVVRYFPVSSGLFVAFLGFCILESAIYAPQTPEVGLVLIFFAVPAFVELRLLPAGDELNNGRKRMRMKKMIWDE
jgi:hypothetical protein